MQNFFSHSGSELEKELAGVGIDTPGRRESFISDLFHVEHADSATRPGKPISCQPVRDETLTLRIPISGDPEPLEQLIVSFLHPSIYRL
jgi:hypothetical protein